MADFKVEDSLIRSIASPNALDAAAEIAELGLDAVLSEGLLRDLPVVGSIVSIARAGVDIRTRLLVRKLSRFVSNLGDVPIEERRKFAEELDQDSDHRERVGEHLITVLDRLDSARKAELLAKAFGAYVSGKIEYFDFLGLSGAIDHCLVHDLAMIPVSDRPRQYLDAAASRLMGSGLLEIDVVPVARAEGVANKYRKTGLARLLLRHVLPPDDDEEKG